MVNLKSSIQRFYGRHHELFNRYGTSVSSLLTDIFCFIAANRYLHRTNIVATCQHYDEKIAQPFGTRNGLLST